jgi:hypothetical protein
MGAAARVLQSKNGKPAGWQIDYGADGAGPLFF